MSTLLIIIILLILFGGGGGYYAHRSYGGRGLGGVLGLVIIIIIVLACRSAEDFRWGAAHSCAALSCRAAPYERHWSGALPAKTPDAPWARPTRSIPCPGTGGS